MNPEGKGYLSGELKDAIEAAYGSKEAFVEAFSKAAATQFGSGWAWLCVHKGGMVLKRGVVGKEVNQVGHGWNWCKRKVSPCLYRFDDAHWCTTSQPVRHMNVRVTR